jgi:carboxyl-terminal processing protease
MSKTASSFAAVVLGSALTLFVAASFPSECWSSPAPAREGAASEYRSLILFAKVFEIVRADYVDKPKDAALIASSINAMVSGLDPHSSYLDAKAFRDMEAETDGRFGGVGMVLTEANGSFKVVSPVDGTPAARAGVRSGDEISEVNSKSTHGLSLEQVAEELRGLPGTTVKVAFIRDDQKTPIDLTLAREIVQLHTVQSHIEGDDVGYIKISEFDAPTTADLKQAIAAISSKMQRGRFKGYILDLRNDPGGLLDQAVSVASVFLSRGKVVSIRGREFGKGETFYAKGGDITHGVPLIVLVNGGTASASEIVAGALQDHKRATILGSQTFGKGSVQTIIPLGKNDGAIRLTTGRYYLPSGSTIQARGITPDIKVPQPTPAANKDQETKVSEASLTGHLRGDGAEQSGSDAYVPSSAQDDSALQRALALLRGTSIDAAFPASRNQAAK